MPGWIDFGLPRLLDITIFVFIIMALVGKYYPSPTKETKVRIALISDIDKSLQRSVRITYIVNS